MLFVFVSCTPRTQASPTLDVGMLATQMWIDLSVQQTLAASIPTETPLPTTGPTTTPTSTFISTPMPTPADPQNAPPAYNPINGMELVYIPAGEFLMGASPYDSDLKEDELPQHSVYLDAFWISKFQVTNAMFNSCVNAGVCNYSASHTTNP
ncbi:MAG: SUMF1/EgtB/PvdO family nonheme iron enzyme, partial [Anaerolineaceae bacterium]|nr:SUMF1/EgtB/PvdO family nonheme iron enzyme [Anaerolineaceae bacterium]